ncbi:TIGR00730 family Rossman fold protein [Aquihabitans sp. G128]|uniref:LOG family protein n=1 Tax=Aquihabitans sp. G128 TaxID=2849779 RepID=UPI001C246942|nr:TIGR00730 family Rossman fold protein [Aquihabitans sp. G128]QXC62061.1 TIGR00730 family Rossman fold protein [Aquihabitans sp. G128]
MSDPTTPATDELSDEVAAKVRELLDATGVEANRDQIGEILATAVRLAHDGTDRLDLKITSSALAEMRNAFRIFAPFHDVPKVTIFGSARTRTDDPLYAQAHEAARALADQGWMVVTGAGPGIMQAAMEGAGADRSIGVSIRLPFETRANDVIHDDPKHVSMKYFFTRKLMLVKESRGFLSVPGGFGTLDETFELLTLQQTGKAEPTPIVLLDVPGGTFWQGFQRFVDEQLVSIGVVSPDDLDRVLITDSVDAAVAEIVGFWRNYDSLRWVGKRLVLRLRAEPTDAEVGALNEQFGDLLVEGRIERSGPLGPERSSHDQEHLPRLVLSLDQHRVGGLHRLIRAVNALGSAPDAPAPPAEVAHPT